MLPNQGRGTKSRHLLQGTVTHPLLMWQVAAKPQKRQGREVQEGRHLACVWWSRGEVGVSVGVWRESRGAQGRQMGVEGGRGQVWKGLEDQTLSDKEKVRSF